MFEITQIVKTRDIYLPFFNTIFKTQPLTLEQLFFCIGMAMVVFHAVEAEKWMKQIFAKK